ncbi:MAG: metal ABC transporter ATP-binding protein [Planctomycetia bacterium]|nr:metal ABC transporter ATP-binding protein [Planctomycetia bacterium]
MTNALLHFRDVAVNLGGKEILRGVTSSLLRGKITALIGLNGSGKTTLLRAIIKEVPYDGQIEFRCGHDHSRPTPQHIGYVPQRLQIEARLPLTVRDLMALALQRKPLFLGISRRVNRMLEGLLQQVWLPADLLDRLVEKLSGGELQRVLLALALQPRPELLLLDEPASGIDFQHEQGYYDLLARLNRETGVTILLVSHELSVVSKHAHWVLCLKDGKIRCEGPPEETATREVVDEIFGAAKGVYTHHHHHHPTPQASG